MSVVREPASRNMTKLYSIMQTKLCLAEIACHQLVKVNLRHVKQLIKYEFWINIHECQPLETAMYVLNQIKNDSYF